MTLGSLLPQYQDSHASLSEVGACAQILQGMYSQEDHYRWIQPSEAYSVEGSITTVVRGIRPFAMIDLPPSSAYILALKTIPGISVVPSPYQHENYHIYRTGAAHLSEACTQLDKMMEERVAKEGYVKIKTYERILDSHKKYGEILYYKPEAIAAFELKIRQMLKDELSKENDGKKKEKQTNKSEFSQ